VEFRNWAFPAGGRSFLSSHNSDLYSNRYLWDGRLRIGEFGIWSMFIKLLVVGLQYIWYLFRLECPPPLSIIIMALGDRLYNPGWPGSPRKSVCCGHWNWDMVGFWVYVCIYLALMTATLFLTYTHDSSYNSANDYGRVRKKSWELSLLVKQNVVCF